MAANRESVTIDSVVDFRAIGFVLCLRGMDSPEDWWIGEAWLGRVLLWTTRLTPLADLDIETAMDAVEDEFCGVLKDMIDKHMGT